MIATKQQSNDAITSGVLQTWPRPVPSVRRGAATLWLLLVLPVLLILLCFVVEMGNVWLARAELEDSLESAALAAVKEWGDANGGSTFLPRRVGVHYAASNSVSGSPGGITNNYNVANSPNENANCNGDLVFGAVTDTSPNVIFNAGVAPVCGVGSVMFDATGQGNLTADNAWGVAFRNTVNTPPGLRIVRIIIDLDAGGGDGEFDDTPVLSDNVPQHKVRDNSGNDQPDIVGFTDPAAQIIFTEDDERLTIDFFPNVAGTDQGFEPGDRFRFGAEVEDVSSGGGADDGDGIGRDNVRVTVLFSLGGLPLPPVSATFVDNMESSNNCFDPAQIDPNPLSNSLVVNPNGVPDLPCPEGSAPGNNGQSFAQIVGGGGGNLFAVRAQATANVNGICGRLFGFVFGPNSVSARTTAVYDCNTRRASLIRVDQFICP